MRKLFGKGSRDKGWPRCDILDRDDDSMLKRVRLLVVIFHDRDLGRMCGLPQKTIADFEYKNLPKLLVPDHLIEAYKGYAPKELERHTRIPLLEELLQEFPTYPMQIDLKFGQESLIQSTMGLLKKYDRQKDTVWGSFLYTTYQRIRKIDPQQSVPLFFPFYRIFLSYAGYQLGLLYMGWMRPQESALIVPRVWPFMNRGYIRALQAQGISVIVFGLGLQKGGLNSFKDYDAMHDLGVDGVCTDRPTLMRDWLAKRFQ
jgi:glycerophosphoryl diester phosphodiesterase